MTHTPDGYRVSRKGTGRLVVSATWKLLRQDRDLLALPALGGLAGLLAFALLIAPGVLIGWSAGNIQAGAVVGGVLGMLLASCVGLYFQAALVLGALQRADGFDPSLGSVLRQTWSYRKRIVQYALLNTTVGVALRAIEQRLGFIGALFVFLGGLAWAVATFFTVPVLIVEGLGPIAATKRSVAIVKQKWGVSARSTLRIGAAQVLAALASFIVAVVGIGVMAGGGSAGIVVGALLILAGIGGFIGTAMIATAVMTYSRTLLYRYAVGLPVPGIAPELLAGVFVQKRRLFRRK